MTNIFNESDENEKQSTKLSDAISVLQNVFYKVLWVNLTEDAFEEIKVKEHEKEASIGYSNKISKWTRGFAEKGNIYCDDMESYLEFCKLSTMKNNLKKIYNHNKKNISIKYRRKIGNEFRWVKMSMLPSTGYSEDNQVCIIYISDIHDEYIKEEKIKKSLRESCCAAENANRQKLEFLSRISHELRTPMNAIFGMSVLANERIDEKEYVAECLEKINMSCNQLLAFIDDTLNYSKLEMGVIALDENIFKISNVIDDAIAMVSPQIEKRNHHLEIDLDDLYDMEIISDRNRIQRVLVNIFGNAVKYTPKGGNIYVKVIENDNFFISDTTIRKYSFIIKDNGIGIPDNFMSSIYEPFMRADNALEIGQQGTGLGMFITKSIINLMNGEIAIKSEEGKGTEVTITLYVKIPEDTAFEKNDSSINETKLLLKDIKERNLSGKHFLIVEDNEVNLEIVVQILNMTGADLLTAKDGCEAVQIFNEKPEDFFDIIFMDLKMPRMNGYEATGTIRNSEKKYAKAVPIIAMSANVFFEDLNKASEAGMNGHISKPMNIKKLAKILNKYIS